LKRGWREDEGRAEEMVRKGGRERRREQRGRGREGSPARRDKARM
jgi:hypothetical protein